MKSLKIAKIGHYWGARIDMVEIARQIFLQKASGGAYIGFDRKFHAYCIGTPRSGTHSIARMFATRYRSAHEPRAEATILKLLEWFAVNGNNHLMGLRLRRRDINLKLEMEASHFLYHVVDILVDTFPSAKFILTIRDPLTWLESEINQNIRTQKYPVWKALENFRYGRYGYNFEKQEKFLECIDNVYPISSYLSYWNDHNLSVVNNVPKHRLLIINTNDIQSRVPDMADFIGIDPNSIDVSHSHSGKRPRKFPKLFQSIDRDFILDKIGHHCNETTSRHFPELNNYMASYLPADQAT